MKRWILILTYIIQSFVIIDGTASIIVFSQTNATLDSCMSGSNVNCVIGLNAYNFSVGLSYLISGCIGLCFCILYTIFETSVFKIVSYVMLAISLCMIQVWGPLMGGFGILTPHSYTSYWEKYYWSAFVMAMFTAISSCVIFGILVCFGCLFCVTNMNST